MAIDVLLHAARTFPHTISKGSRGGKLTTKTIKLRITSHDIPIAPIPSSLFFAFHLLRSYSADRREAIWIKFHSTCLRFLAYFFDHPQHTESPTPCRAVEFHPGSEGHLLHLSHLQTWPMVKNQPTLMILEGMDAGIQNGLPFYRKASILGKFNFWLDLLFLAWEVSLLLKTRGSYQQSVV